MADGQSDEGTSAALKCMLRKRIITSLFGIPLLVAAVWFEQPLPWFTVLVAIWGLAAAFEFYRMVNNAGGLPVTSFALVWVLLFITSPHFDYAFIIPSLLTSALVLPGIWLVIRHKKGNAAINWAWTVVGILYIGWLLSHLVTLRGLEDGRNWVFFALFANFASDIAAFFVGRTLGRHRLAPKISPNKTWEGAIGGVLGAIIIALLFTLATPLGLPLGYGQAILMGLLVSVFGQLGDLVESLFKRNTGVKDSGNLIPGHGGALDRIDSVIFAGAAVYYYLLFAGGA